jgi:hypothetical protein
MSAADLLAAPRSAAQAGDEEAAASPPVFAVWLLLGEAAQ